MPFQNIDPREAARRIMSGCEDKLDAVAVARALLADPATQATTFSVWVRLGYGFAAGLFLEDVTQYLPPDEVRDHYQEAILTLTGKARKPKAHAKGETT